MALLIPTKLQDEIDPISLYSRISIFPTRSKVSMLKTRIIQMEQFRSITHRTTEGVKTCGHKDFELPITKSDEWTQDQKDKFAVIAIAETAHAAAIYSWIKEMDPTLEDA